MCGIWGVFPTDLKGFYLHDVGPVKQAMILTSLRGDDSTGIALVADPHTKARVWKGLGGPAYILNGDAWEKITEFMTKKARVVFGHGRSATKGAVTAKNAHPFTHEHITLVHNGTISSGLDDEHKEAETEVDSHALAVAIAKKGLVDALYDIGGAYALIVQDTKEGCIYVVRNDERPLSRLVTFDRHIIMSEGDALKYFAGKNSVTAPKIEYFPKHVIFKYDLKTATWSTDQTLKEKMEKKWLPTTTHWPQNTCSGGQTDYGSSTKYSNTKWGTGASTAGTREYDSYQPIELLCTKVSPQPQGHSYKYEFVDDDAREFVGISSYHEKDKEGKLCRTLKHTVITVKATGEVTRFLKYRDLEWFDEDAKEFKPSRLKVIESTPLAPQAEPPPETEEMTHVLTYNGRRLKKDRWKTICAKTDCSICQGPVLEGEAENTYVTEGDGVICSDCISKKKHHQYGYGQ